MRGTRIEKEVENSDNYVVCVELECLKSYFILNYLPMNDDRIFLLKKKMMMVQIFMTMMMHLD
jgi:hypothetical protein